MPRIAETRAGAKSSSSGEGSQCVWVHEGLREASARLRELLERYLFLRCSDILSPASNLVHAIKGSLSLSEGRLERIRAVLGP